jgi:hypothetical protein
LYAKKCGLLNKVNLNILVVAKLIVYMILKFATITIDCLNEEREKYAKNEKL